MAWLNSTSWYKGNPNYMTFKEAAAVTSEQFSGTNNTYKAAIVTFDEARFFTSVTYLTPTAFYNCKLLERITLPNTLTEIRGFSWDGYGCFALCTSLVDVDMSDGVTTIGGRAFNGCTSLALTSLPNGLTTIGLQAFQSCLALKDTLYEIPSSVTEIGDRAFRYVKFSALKFLGLTPPTFGTQSIYARPQKVDCQVPSASIERYRQNMAVLTNEGYITISEY